MTEIKTEDFEKLGQFYLGKRFDYKKNQAKDGVYLYDSRDLLTHAVCIGMTGSGKTGLCLGLLEEAAMDGIPVIAIDPKGDLGNLLLTFPNLSASEFAPWISEEEAQRKNITKEEFAQLESEKWKEGLKQWGQDANRIKKLRDTAEFNIYTPGSTAGKPVSIISSFKAPEKSIVEDRELLGDKISNLVTSILGLINVDADPLTSREHILVSKIIEHAWTNGEDLELTSLVQMIQSPPVTKIGAFDLEAFFPSKDRFGLAMSINNLIASPGFEVWMEGESLDIDSLFFNKDGKPKISIFSINHLDDSERMFFVSILLNQLLSWMRAQSGSTSLRSLFYMDEIFGYFPPVANPPSKKPLLTLLKQARAFGLGLVLSTQNPADLDYKGLSNAGTWFIGRLQTERDRQKVLEGLETGSSESNKKFEELLPDLGNRVFLVNNVHDQEPELIQTRWAMSYLRGPFSRKEIKMVSNSSSQNLSLNNAPEKKDVETREPQVEESPVSQRPIVNPKVEEYFIPSSSKNTMYKPMLLVSGWARFSRSRPPVDLGKNYTYLFPFSDGPFPVNWDSSIKLKMDLSRLSKEPVDSPSFQNLISQASDEKSYTKWEKEFKNWIYKNKNVVVFKSKALKASSQAGESERDFKIRLQQLAREKRDEHLDKLKDKYESKMSRLESRIRTAERALEREKRQAQDAAMQSAFNIGASLLGAFVGRRKTISGNIRRASSAARSASRAANQQGDVAFQEAKLNELNSQMSDLEANLKEEIQELESKVASLASENIDSVTIRAKKTDIGCKLVSLVWVPEDLFSNLKR